MVRGQADALRTATSDMAAVLRQRGEARQQLVRLSQAAEDTLHPRVEFAMAKRLVAYLRQQGIVDLTMLDDVARAIGADDAEDAEFMAALRIASDDGRVYV